MVSDPDCKLPDGIYDKWAKSEDVVRHVDGSSRGLVGVMDINWQLVLRNEPVFTQDASDWHSLTDDSRVQLVGWLDYYALKAVRIDGPCIPVDGKLSAATCLSLRSLALSQERTFDGFTWHCLRDIMATWPPVAFISANAMVCELLFQRCPSICYSTAVLAKKMTKPKGLIEDFPTRAQLLHFGRVGASALGIHTSSEKQEAVFV